MLEERIVLLIFMPAIAITGTIGSGKSLVLQLMKNLLGAEIYSADEANRLLLDTDAVIKRLIIARFGSSCYKKDGKADREKISGIIRSDLEARADLEQILHPRLAACWKPKAEFFSKSLKQIKILAVHSIYW